MRAPSPVARCARDCLSVGRGRIIGANDDYSASGMFVRTAFGYVLWRTSSDRRMPLSGLQAENWERIRLWRVVSRERRPDFGGCDGISFGSATMAAISRIVFARDAVPPCFGGLTLSPMPLRYRQAASRTSLSRRRPRPFIMRAGGIRGLRYEPSRSRNAAETSRGRALAGAETNFIVSVSGLKRLKYYETAAEGLAYPGAVSYSNRF